MSDENRRPLTSRNTAWAARLTAWAVARDITPNQISQASMGFSALGFLFFALSVERAGFAQFLSLVLAALTIQARLICNLIDGMVAIEGGKGTSDGPFWNEAPDRVADLVFLAGAGLAAGQPDLGLLAGSLSIGTAYVRELGRAEGFPPDFSGPLAKPQRMAVLTAGSLAAAFFASEWTLTVTLWIVVAGTAFTILSRSLRLVRNLRSRT